LIHLHESLEIARKIADVEMESVFLSNVGRAYFERGQYNQVLIFIQQQLDIFDRTNDKRGKYSALEDFGQCYTMLRQYDQALQYAKEALSLVRELGDKFKKVALSIMIVPPWRSANDKLAMQVAIGEILGIKT
jgi:tetratricopeptide (TPR) repeat protein